MNESIVIERRIAASPATVYAFFTDAAKWARWQGVAVTAEARAGGAFLLTMANGSLASGRFVELVPHERIVFTWGWVDHPGVPPGSSTVSISLIAEEFGTLLRLTHSGLPVPELPLHQKGWDHYLPRLAAVAEGSDPGLDPGI